MTRITDEIGVAVVACVCWIATRAAQYAPRAAWLSIIALWVATGALMLTGCGGGETQQEIDARCAMDAACVERITRTTAQAVRCVAAHDCAYERVTGADTAE